MLRYTSLSTTLWTISVGPSVIVIATKTVRMTTAPASQIMSIWKNSFQSIHCQKRLSKRRCSCSSICLTAAIPDLLFFDIPMMLQVCKKNLTVYQLDFDGLQANHYLGRTYIYIAYCLRYTHVYYNIHLSKL